MPTTAYPAAVQRDVETLWQYNQLHHDVRPTDVGIGLGSHDLGVATHTAELYQAGMFPLIVFTGANAPTTVERFPRGEAVHYREHAIERGVPSEAILVEPRATNTSENIDFTRAVLTDHGLAASIRSVTLISRPYQQRRSYAIFRKHWPEVEVICSSLPLELDEYIAAIGDADRVIDMLVGDTQRIWLYPERGWAIAQDVPTAIKDAFDRLVNAGYTSRLLPD
ncbi:YdcF family protein [Nocardia neocaledoniensis]|uniref:YdcF family protein n=1 Tax=Nocardia neocaledoniensis TaxID=236511 RepID=UPI0024564D21|nr:YdcF family protein [Nocardia neocaledoniensis]